MGAEQHGRLPYQWPKTDMAQPTGAEFLLYTTVKITARTGGAVAGYGTGFFYTVPLGGTKTALLLVTNKHVVEGADEVVVLCHTSDEAENPSGNHVECVVQFKPTDLLNHPDPHIDLCAVSFTGVVREAIKSGHKLLIAKLTAADIPSPEQWKLFDAIEDVLMVGCPRGLFDEVNNLPIVRRGITATPLSIRYNGQEEFLIDMACFPGSSGSPVFLLNNGGFLDKTNNVFVLGGRRMFLLGVLHAGPVISNSGEIVLGHSPRVEVTTMMHLGQVIRSTQIDAIEAEVRRRASQADAEGTYPAS